MKEKRRKLIMKIILVIIYLILTVSGLILMKLGNNPGSIKIEDKTFQFGISLVSAAGFICYLCSFLLFTRIVCAFDLSYIMPVCTGITQVLILIASNVIFKEKLSKQMILGASLVIIGIVIMNIKTAKV